MTRRVATVAVAVLFAAVLLSFLVYTQQMADVLRRDAAVFSRFYALTFEAAAETDREDQERLTDEALFQVLGELERLRIPVVLTDSLGEPTSWAYLPFEVDEDDPTDVERVRRYARELDRGAFPLRPGFNIQVHFGEPLILRRLKWIPWLQAALLLAVVGGGAWMVFTSFRSERERIWSAMARESAHQMGTPLSSLVGWLEQLEGAGAPREDGGPDLVGEMEADVQRLLKVSRRFELIGRAPTLEAVSVGRIVEQLRRYFSARLPTLGSAVRFEIDIPPEAPLVRGNETLLEWAFENLIKNALDALAGRDGTIGVSYAGRREARGGERAAFRVRDTGPGVPPQVRGKLFEIGVTTKERGWGVGLSLTRRIVEEMHGGEIALESGGEGASFRLELPVAVAVRSVEVRESPARTREAPA